jgi:hypothetical protein
MLMLLGFVERLAAGEHQVGAPHQLTLEARQVRVGILERRQFVHAVVDDRVG